MKLLHLADLHIGKRVNEFSMLEDQDYILKKILNMIKTAAIDGVLIAGDIYDKPIPSAEAVTLFDHFLVSLVKEHKQVFIISGNHDSAERLQFGSRIMDSGGIHICGGFNGSLNSYIMRDSNTSREVEIFLLPFIRPAVIRPFFPEIVIETYEDAVRAILGQLKLNKDRFNILLAHQFVTGASLGGSEEMSVGGMENISAECFDGFDYVALGHIHSSQSVGGKETVRYAGTPLKYSFAEESHHKRLTVVEIGEQVSVSFSDISPLHDMRTIRGTFAELMENSSLEDTKSEDYLQIILTDEEEMPEALHRLRLIYPRIMTLKYDNARTRMSRVVEAAEDLKSKTPLELFEELFSLQNNCEMNEQQKSMLAKEIGRIWEA